MKRKIISVLLTLVLVLSFSLVTAVPAGASPGTLKVVPYTLQTGDNAASWSTVQKATGSYSVLLNYVSGDNSYVEFTPATGITVNDLASITDGWSWWYYASAAYGPLLELRFSAPGSGHVDITVNTAETSPAITTGTTEEVTNASTCIYFGNDDTDQTPSFSNNTGSVTLAGVLASINAQQAMLDGAESAAAWELTRVRAEIGWSTPARTCYIDDIKIAGVTYYGKIQDAIGSAAAGDTINVAAGEYNEQVAIPSGKDGLTLVGNSATDTIIQAPSGIITTINVASPSVTIREFWIKAPLGTAQQAVISLGAGAVSTSGNEGVIEDNKIEGTVPTGAFANIVLLEATDYWEIKDNEFVGGKSSIAFNGADYILVSGNSFSNGGVGSTENSDNVTISDNQFLVDAGIGIATSATNLTIVRNTITGADSGIKVWGTADISTVVVRYNSISGNINYGIEGSANAAATLDARYNWWGAATGPDDDGNKNPYFTQAETALADACSTNVDFIPWMIHTDLASGWNIYSTPIASGTSTNTITEALDLWTSDSAKVTGAYYFSGSSQSWVMATSLTPLVPVYLNMSAAATIDVLMSTSYNPPPSMTMYQGWNLVGPAELYSMDVDDALGSAYWASGAANLVGYGQVLSPGINQTAVWTFLRPGAMYSGDESPPDVLPTEGYWVYMVNQGSLGGFTYTPITLLP